MIDDNVLPGDVFWFSSFGDLRHVKRKKSAGGGIYLTPTPHDANVLVPDEGMVIIVAVEPDNRHRVACVTFMYHNRLFREPWDDLMYCLLRLEDTR